MHDDMARSSGKDSSIKPDLVLSRLEDIASMAMSRFYSYRYDLVPNYWRYIYTHSLILTTYYHLLKSLFWHERSFEETLDGIVENLDRAVITTGGAGPELGASWIEKTLELLESFWQEKQVLEPPLKRQRVEKTFSSHEPYGRIQLSSEHECPRHRNWSLEMFERYMNDGTGEPRPIVFDDLIQHWPALSDHPWNSYEYLLSRTFGGRRLVPVEIGRSYVDDSWGQELMPFKTFLEKHIDPSLASSETATPYDTGYLAQHDLFHQIPSLRSDIQVPDFCWADVPGHPTDPSQNKPQVEVPRLNAWLGPARTITPLHTDAYHNLFCQVVGTKYVRLYPPAATAKLRPRTREGGVDMSNTSALDLGVLEGWDDGLLEGEETAEDMAKIAEDLRGVEYWECILKPGDTLVIPIGWWHYVRSLSVSFSVSFWWN
jgi:lysine-specific demethylase 8/division protein 1